MKRILVSLTLVGIVACSLAGFAQTNSPAGDAAAASATTNQDAAQPTAPADKAPAAEAPAPAAATQVAAAEPAQPAAVPEAAKAANSPVQLGAVIPLIVMDDVPLTDAIRNLARQAAINYMLDPKIGFGQIGPDGKPAAQPNVSIRWENITAEQALAALLNNYTLQLVEDPKSKISRVTVRDPAAPPPLYTKIIQLKYAGPSNVLASVQSIFMDKRSKVMPDNRTSQLVVVATETEIAGVDQLIERLDTQTKQVLIEARLIETSINPSTIKGVDWTGTLAAQHVTMGNNALPGVASTPSSMTTNGVLVPGTPGTIGGILSSPQLLMNASHGSFFNPAMAFLNADGVSAVISFINNYSESRVLSAPRTVTLDNEPAVIEVTRETPVINVTAGTANTTGGSSITYSNLGVILNVTPRISANDYVNLKVIPEVSRNAGTVSKTIAGETYQADEYDVRRVTTRVMIPSGNTLVMGGMVSDSVNTSNIKVPLLGDLPLLGSLFRSDSKNRLKQNLLIFITPTIVQDQDFQPTKSDFLKSQVPAQDSMDKDWSAWDSGKPYDWSKHAAKPESQDPNSMTK